MKFRHENKYIIDERRYQLLIRSLTKVMDYDENITFKDEYFIRSVYFDDLNNTSFFDVDNGTYKRSKYRIRMYDMNSEKIYLEEKNKYGEFVNKHRCVITKKEYKKIIEGDISFLLKKNDMTRRMYIKIRNQLLVPRIIIDYQRKPLLYSHSDVRITFDYNVRASIFNNNFFDQNLTGYRISNHHEYIVEVKYKKFVPSIIEKIITSLDIRRTNFSKYYLSFKYLHEHKIIKWDV